MSRLVHEFHWLSVLTLAGLGVVALVVAVGLPTWVAILPCALLGVAAGYWRSVERQRTSAEAHDAAERAIQAAWDLVGELHERCQRLAWQCERLQREQAEEGESWKH